MKYKYKILNIIFFPILIFFFATSLVHADGLSVKMDGIELEGKAIFELDDVKPGDEVTKVVAVENGYEFEQNIHVVCEEVEELKDLSEILELTISVNSTPIFTGSLKDYCDDTDGEDLGAFGDGEEKDISFYVYFPHEAGNEYQQGKFVFNLIFGVYLEEGGHIVINEVYYDVESDHGRDSDDEGGCCGVPDGLEDYDIHEVFGRCFILSRFPIPEHLGSSNNIFGVHIMRIGCCCGGRNDEWVELYNPTDNDVSLKDWYIKDDSGVFVKINANKTIESHGYALLSKSASTWRFWDEDRDAEKVEWGRIFGNGLGNSGDHLRLYDEYRNEVDAVGWGNDTNVWTSGQPTASEGNSIERIVDGVDTDVASDWSEEAPPSPGY